MANEYDPNTTPHPSPVIYETCGVCGYAYKLRGNVCARCNTAEPPTEGGEGIDVGTVDDGAPAEPAGG